MDQDQAEREMAEPTFSGHPALQKEALPPHELGE